jgi:hypothetical protein
VRVRQRRRIHAPPIYRWTAWPHAGCIRIAKARCPQKKRLPEKPRPVAEETLNANSLSPFECVCITIPSDPPYRLLFPLRFIQPQKNPDAGVFLWLDILPRSCEGHNGLVGEKGATC